MEPVPRMTTLSGERSKKARSAVCASRRYAPSKLRSLIDFLATAFEQRHDLLFNAGR